MTSTFPNLLHNLKQYTRDVTEKKVEIKDQLHIIQYLKNAFMILYVTY